MSLGNRLLELRKKKNLSQEEVAEKLNVTRQTISKWETDQSIPDFDKIVPLCELYGISANELLTGTKENIENNQSENISNINKEEAIKNKAKGIGTGVILYFIAVAWIMICIPVLNLDPVISSSIFLLICGIATCIIIYVCMVYKKEKTKQEEKEEKIRKQIENILASITVCIYLIISFITMAWHITWIIWIIYGLICEIIKLIFMLKEDTYEK